MFGESWGVFFKDFGVNVFEFFDGEVVIILIVFVIFFILFLDFVSIEIYIVFL